MKALRELPESEVIDLVKAWRKGTLQQYHSYLGEWVGMPTHWSLIPGHCYRIVKTPITLDWSHLDAAFIYVAKDEDGDVCAFKTEPEVYSDVWRTGGLSILLSGRFSSVNPGTVPWDESLITR